MKKLIPVFAFLALAGCASPPPPLVQQQADKAPPIKLNVLTVMVLDRTMPDGMPTPYTTNDFQPTIANALRRWATEKLVAVGTTGEAYVVIQDATLHSEKIPHPDSMFTREQTSKYTTHAKLELDIVRKDEHGQVTAEASQFVTLPDQPTAEERQNAYNKLFNAVMADMGSNLRKGVKDHLGQFVAPQ